MSKVFKVTESNQYIQTVALSKGEYVFQCNVKHHKDVLTIALKDGSNVWHEYEVPCKKNTWVDKAQLKFTTTVDMTAFSLCYKDASTQNPVYIEKPVLKMGTEIGVISPNYKDLIEELESSLVINNGEGSLLNGLLDITELTNNKGSANLSLDVGKSILRKNVSLVKNKEGKDGEQGNTPYIEDGYWFIDGQPTGIKAEGEDGAEGISPHIGSNGNWYVGTVDTGIKAKGDKGDTGLPGQIPIQKEWVAGDTHRNNDEIVDYIYVRNIATPSLSNWYKLSAKGTVTADAPPTGGTTPPGYEKINWLKELAVNVLLAEEANVAGFIFKDNKLISEKGTVGGVDADYSGQANFVPNLILNGAEGDVKITGTVNATSGVFTGALSSPFERTKSTYTKDFSNNLIVTGSTFTLPWNQLGSGRLIRLIQPNPGTPYCIAPTGKYFYEDGEQKDKLTMFGAEIIELLGYTDSQGNFTGWLVLNRGLLHTVSTWGEPHRIVAYGHVKTNNPFKYHTFDGSTLTTSTGEYNSRKYTSIVMPSKWFDSKDAYYVKIIANEGDSAAFHTVQKYTNYTFDVYQHSLNLANGTLSPTTTFDFYFEIYSAAWLYPKSGGAGMPGEEW